MFEADLDEEKQECVMAMLENKRGRIQWCREELERLRAKAAQAAKALLIGTNDLPDPEVVVCQKTASNSRINERIEEALKEIEALGLEEETEQQEQVAEQQQKAEQDQVEYEEEVVLPEQQQKTEQHQEASEELVPLRRFDKGFEKWLKQKSEEDLERILCEVMSDHPHKDECKAYVDCVKSLEHMVKNCTKCRRGGCESCTYVHALRYVVRHQKPGSWWRRTGQSAVLGAARYLKAHQ